MLYFQTQLWIQKIGSKEHLWVVVSSSTPALSPKYTRLHCPCDTEIGRPQQAKAVILMENWKYSTAVSLPSHLSMNFNEHLNTKSLSSKANLQPLFVSSTLETRGQASSFTRLVHMFCHLKYYIKSSYPCLARNRQELQWQSSLSGRICSNRLNSVSDQRPLVAQEECKMRVLKQSL